MHGPELGASLASEQEWQLDSFFFFPLAGEGEAAIPLLQSLSRFLSQEFLVHPHIFFSPPQTILSCAAPYVCWRFPIQNRAATNAAFFKYFPKFHPPAELHVTYLIRAAQSV